MLRWRAKRPGSAGQLGDDDAGGVCMFLLSFAHCYFFLLMRREKSFSK